MLYNFSLDYGIRNVQENEGGLKLKGACNILSNVDNLNLFDDNVITVQKSTEALQSKETGLEANAEKAKCMSMSLHQRQAKIVILVGKHR
jgi:hypothetical protein